MLVFNIKLYFSNSWKIMWNVLLSYPHDCPHCIALDTISGLVQGIILVVKFQIMSVQDQKYLVKYLWCPCRTLVSQPYSILVSLVSRPPIVASICCTPAAPTPLGPLGARLPIKNEGKRKKADVKKDKCSHKTIKIVTTFKAATLLPWSRLELCFWKDYPFLSTINIQTT